MGLKLVLPGINFSDVTLPVLPVYDPIESSGSLLLFDPSHPLGAFSGVPTTGNLTNIVSPLSAIVTGQSASTLHPNVIASAITNNIFEVERTTKLGIHAMVTQGGTQTGENFWGFALSNNLRDYLRANILGHQFYMSVWSRLTRQALTNAYPQSIAQWIYDVSNYGWLTNYGGFSVPAGNASNSNGNFMTSAIGAPLHMSTQANGWVGSQSHINTISEIAVAMGTKAPFHAFSKNKTQSMVLYRVYIEDLTVSGRTYQQVYDLDIALHTEAFGAGGRFNGDTYSDPLVACP